MATESPLFQSSMELLGHSISHFNGAKELDRKLVILHLANAIELILKDLVLDAGGSIYKNPKETVTIHSCLEALGTKNVSLPYLNKIELLIDERNSLQHRYGSPNELTTIFYMTIAVDFFRCILKDFYGQDFDEIIAQFADDKDLLAFKMREPSNESELNNLKKLAKVHPLGALLSAVTYLERIIAAFSSRIGLDEGTTQRRLVMGAVSHKYLAHLGIVPPSELLEEMDQAWTLRNRAAHGKIDPSKEEVISAITTIERYESFLASLAIQDVEDAIARKTAEETERRNRDLARFSRPTNTADRADG